MTNPTKTELEALAPLVERIRRAWREFRNPALKCERIGHNPDHRWYRGFEKPSKGFRCVADSVSGEISYCGRCHVHLGRTVTERNGIHELSLDTSVFYKLRTEGFVESQF